MSTMERIDLEQAILNCLKEKGIAKEGKHYTVDPNGMGTVWDDNVYAAVVQAVFAIDAVLLWKLE